jgi:hypothetical protein
MPQVRLHTRIPANRAGWPRTATQTATLEARKIRYYSNSRLPLFSIKDNRLRPTMLVYLACSEPGSSRRCANGCKEFAFASRAQ